MRTDERADFTYFHIRMTFDKTAPKQQPRGGLFLFQKLSDRRACMIFYGAETVYRVFHTQRLACDFNMFFHVLFSFIDGHGACNPQRRAEADSAVYGRRADGMGFHKGFKADGTAV